MTVINLLFLGKIFVQNRTLQLAGDCCCSVLDLDAFERCNKAEGLGVSDGTTQAKNLQDTDNTCKLFRFLQLLCEGHNLGTADYCVTCLLTVHFSMPLNRLIILSPSIPLRLYTLSYCSNPPFLIFDIWALWRSGLSARAPECQKIVG